MSEIKEAEAAVAQSNAEIERLKAEADKAIANARKAERKLEIAREQAAAEANKGITEEAPGHARKWREHDEALHARYAQALQELKRFFADYRGDMAALWAAKLAESSWLGSNMQRIERSLLGRDDVAAIDYVLSEQMRGGHFHLRDGKQLVRTLVMKTFGVQSMSSLPPSIH